MDSEQREIERKFLVTDASWRERVSGDGEEIVQGYLHVGADEEVRVRVRDGDAMLTVKRGGQQLGRLEVEVPLARGAAEELLDGAIVGRTVRKRRFEVPLEGGDELVAEVDVFLDVHEGLVIAEVELPDDDTPLPDVDWLGDEVTGDPRYYNAALATSDNAALATSDNAALATSDNAALATSDGVG